MSIVQSITGGGGATGPVVITVTASGGTYVAPDVDAIIQVEGLAAFGHTVELPSPATSARRYTIKDKDGASETNILTIVTGGAANLDDDPMLVIAGNRDAIQVYGDGVDYYTE